MIQEHEQAIYFGDTGDFIETLNLSEYSKIFILCDSNTAKHCLPILTAHLGRIDCHVIRMEAGEQNKSLETCRAVWNELVAHGADRYSLLINLGGGVVTDLGGYCGASYMRGLHFVHIPTSLLAQVDASVGGKTGIDFLNYKNLIGSFTLPVATCIDVLYLQTLPSRELANGAVEVWKHALITDQSVWSELIDKGFPECQDMAAIVQQTVELKQNIVSKDPLESGHRKLLNFGHTIGHALERVALSLKKDIRHGEAVAFGIIAASRLSTQYADLAVADRIEIEKILSPYCTILPTITEVDGILKNINLDKKNKDGVFRFVLLDKIGKGKIDVEIDPNDVKASILEAIESINNLK